MIQQHVRDQKVAIVGGGITGLSLAHRLHELAPQLNVRLFEASGRIGGILGTVREAEFLIEQSADMFSTAEPWAIKLCERLDAASGESGPHLQLISTNSEFRRAFILSRGRLEQVPLGFSLMSPGRMLPILFSRLLSWPGKARLMSELFVRRRESLDDESLASFARRRLGREAYERIVQPLVGGIYTADPERLSMAATLDRFRKMEREHGGLIRGAWAREKKSPGTAAMTAGVRYSEFVAPKHGMQSMVDALFARLPAGTVVFNSAVESIQRLPNHRWQIRSEVSQPASPEEFDYVVLALPAWQSARVVRSLDAQLSTQLSAIPFASAAVVVLALPKSQIEHPLDGFGFVVPVVEERRILACSFSSVKFSGRAPDDQVLMRIFMGGALQPELLSRDDPSLIQLAKDEISMILGVRGNTTLERVIRWNNAMPQYHLGHSQRVAEIEARVKDFPKLQVIGNAFHGVGIPFCIRQGEQAAERIVQQFGPNCHSQSCD